ncbi:MAG: serine/threonine-protein kinase [Kofleriaceae bacterium]
MTRAPVDDPGATDAPARVGEPVGVDATLVDASGGGAAAAARSLPARWGTGAAADYPQLASVDPAHYVVEREIARGGMGRVVVARDRRLGRVVAVKELVADDAGLARRFEREARITARLQHPSIISVHEAGTWPSGEPFYAMRLVAGRSLEQAIADTTSYAERLALLPNVLAVADAMAYAHGEGVIHRDLKPANIVVGRFGETVVIDWGLVKELGVATPPAATSIGDRGSRSGHSAGGDTVVGDVIGTPAFMPPEQANGAAVDARADVYAIGAVLYNVLAGRAPFVGDTTAELLAAVHSGPPPRLRAVVPQVATELAAVVERAMARDPAARYPTALALAEDLRRFQTGQLVGAHRYSLRQLLARQLRQHRTAVAATTAAMVVAVTVGVVAIRRVVRAEGLAQRERAAAIANRGDAEDLMQFMLGELRGKLARLGKLDLLDDVARRAVAYYDRRGVDAAAGDLDKAVLARIGLGQVVRLRGDLPGALAEFRKAAALADQREAAHPDDVAAALSAERVRGEIAETLDSLGDLPAALASYRAANARLDALRAAAPADVELLAASAQFRSRTGAILKRQREFAAALEELQAALALAEALAGQAPSEGTDRLLLTIHGHLGDLRYAQDEPALALAEQRASLAIAEQRLALMPDAPSWMADVAVSYQDVGRALNLQGDHAAAVAAYRAGLTHIERAIAIEPANTHRLDTRAVLQENLGVALLAAGDRAGAAAEFTASAATWADLSARDPANLEWQRGRSMLANKLGDLRLADGDPAGALRAYGEALAIRQRLVATDPTNTEWRRNLFFCHYKLAKAHRAAGDLAQTAASFRAAAAIADAALAAHPADEGAADDAARTHAELGVALGDLRDRAGAVAELQAALALAEAMAARPGVKRAWATLVAELREELDGRAASTAPHR